MKLIKETFYSYNKAERRGILLLTLLFIIAVLIYIFLPSYLSSETETPKPLDKILAQLEVQPEVKERVSTEKITQPKKKREFKKRTYPESKTTYKKRSYPPIQAFDFNPNTVSSQDLKKMRLAPHIIKVIGNFRNRGGVFREKEDLKKIYGITDSIYAILSPHVIIPEVESYQARDEVPTISFVDINLATAKEFTALRGIGPVLSERIVKYRKGIGGFHEIEQLQKVYGISDSLYQALEPFLSASGKLEQININTADIKSLSSSYLISYKQAKVIVNYRKQHGDFKTVEELLKTKVIKPEKLNELKPYLKI
jgi:competence ComEA-like helix-hairpin-helix protein